MCGIVGVVPTRHNDEFLRRIKEDFEGLLLFAQSRGRDATGAFVVSNKGEIFFAKSPGPATYFTATTSWNDLMDKVDKNTVALVGHTRFQTLGSPAHNENNHPLVDGNIVGVHNGMITNYAQLDQRYKSVAEVDSAGIVASCRYHSKAKPLDTDTVAIVASELSGSFACVLADARKSDRIWLMRNTGSPLVLSMESHGIYFASTEPMFRYGTMSKAQVYSLPPHSVMELTGRKPDGKTVSMKSFTPFVEPISPVRVSPHYSDRYDECGWKPFQDTRVIRSPYESEKDFQQRKKRWPWLR